MSAEISELKLTTPVGESTLDGTLTDWKSPKYNFNVQSTVDLMQVENCQFVTNTFNIALLYNNQSV